MGAKVADKSESIPWTRKHQPKSFGEVVGQSEAAEALIKFVRGFDPKRSKKKAALLYGPVGCGKTSSVYAIAAELGLEVLETNASDFRNAEGINSVAGNASRQMSLFSKGKVILIDEIDGLAGREDRGGVGAVQDVIEGSAFPVVMTANDPFDKKFAPLRKVSAMIEFRQLSSAAVKDALAKVAASEKVKVEDDTLAKLANRSAGDLRGSITDLQLLCSGTGKLTREMVDELSERNRSEEVESALLRVFKTTDVSIAAGAFENVEMQPEECFAWMDENLPSEYKKPEELAEAYDALSRADVFRGRIMRRQHWRLLSYFIQVMTIGTAIAKGKKYDGVSALKQPSRGLKMFIAKARFQNKLDVAEKIASKLHSPKSAVLSDTLPFMKVIFSKEKDREKLGKIASELGLADEEVEWLTRQS
ncbi:replication factor C large subunit [Candidatus Woesearchaeota archaeon]|nr:replication factor C large subunit [Candidatus Woesearchaeota archaeon]